LRVVAGLGFDFREALEGEVERAFNLNHLNVAAGAAGEHAYAAVALTGEQLVQLLPRQALGLVLLPGAKGSLAAVLVRGHDTVASVVPFAGCVD